ncbi:MAG: GNAT family N-acetyltransferase [Candidatus Binatia bacterium]
MPAYRFCRTDDVPLLVDAYNACWMPHFGADHALSIDAFKRDVRELNLWPSSCMVAMADGEPVGVLLAAKREDGNFIHRIAVKPGHERRGHSGHLIDSLRRKIAILGPPRLLVEIPAEWAAARGFFERCGFAAEARYADFIMDAPRAAPEPSTDLIGRATFAELADTVGLATASRRSWERSPQTLKNRGDRITGLAIASDAQVEAYLLDHARPPDREIVALGGARRELLPLLVAARAADVAGALRVPRVGEDEIDFATLTALGFRAEREYIGYAADFSDL